MSDKIIKNAAQSAAETAGRALADGAVNVAPMPAAAPAPGPTSVASANPLARLAIPDVVIGESEAFPAKCFGRRPEGAAIRCIVLHWGGFDIDHCRRTLIGRGLSSHGGIGPGRVELWVPPTARAYHAGRANDWSVGFDLCQSPELRFKAQTRTRGMAAEEIANVTGRGPKRCIAPDPRLAETARGFVLAIAAVLGVEFRVPRGTDGLADSGPVYHGVIDVETWLASGGGVLGHHHVSAKKWDIAPWWDRIFGGTAIG